MEEKLELSDGDCKRYYQLVQDKISPEYQEINKKPTLMLSKVDGDVEDLGLFFNDTSDRSNNNVFPRKATLKYFERDNEDDEEVEGSDEDCNGMHNGDGHYIMDDDAWSDYWDNGVDDIDIDAPKYFINPIETKETRIWSMQPHNLPQFVTDMVNGNTIEKMTSLEGKVI